MWRSRGRIFANWTCLLFVVLVDRNFVSSISKLKFKKKTTKTLLKTIFKQVFPSLSSTWLQLFIAGGDAHGQIQTLCVRNRYRDQLNTGIPRPTPSVRLLYLSVESVQRAALYQRSANHSQHRSSTVRQRESRQHQCTLFKLFFFLFLAKHYHSYFFAKQHICSML